jgi:hypothetical protein
MAQSASKGQFVGDLQTCFNGLIQAKQQAADLVNYYFKNGFNAGGSNPIADGDVSAYGLTAAKVASAVTLMQQLASFFANAAVTTGDYEATVQAVRTT